MPCEMHGERHGERAWKEREDDCCEGVSEQERRRSEGQEGWSGCGGKEAESERGRRAAEESSDPARPANEGAKEEKRTHPNCFWPSKESEQCR